MNSVSTSAAPARLAPATRFDRRVQAEQLHRAEGTRRRRKLEHERRYPAEGMARQLGARWLFPVRPRNIGMAAAATNLTMPTVTLPHLKQPLRQPPLRRRHLANWPASLCISASPSHGFRCSIRRCDTKDPGTPEIAVSVRHPSGQIGAEFARIGCQHAARHEISQQRLRRRRIDHESAIEPRPQVPTPVQNRRSTQRSAHAFND